MSETATRDVPVFGAGDTIRIEVGPSDDNGVARAEIRFRNKNRRSVTRVKREIELGGER
jgi:hypothetical protein